MHPLLAHQIRKASRDGTGQDIDWQALLQLVNTAYTDADNQRRLLNRAHSIMIEEIETVGVRLHDALASIGAGLAIWDAGDRLILCNERLKRMLPQVEEQLRPGVLFATHVEQGLALGVFDLGNQKAATWLDDRLARHRQADGAVEVRLSDGHILSVRETRTKGGGTVSLFTDITDLKRKEHELRRSKDLAEAANRTKSGFLANMSHELRTPLNAILGFSEALRDGHFGALTNTQREYIQDIYASGKHLLDLISSILDISRIEMNRATLDDEILDLGVLISDALKMMHGSWSRGGLTLRLEVEPGLPPVRADAMRIKQVLLNLMSNAAKFTPIGGQVTVRTERAPEGGVRIVISDTGIGMAAADIPKALTPFGQIENALSRKHDGVGLGLPLSKAFVDLHGGELQIKSEVGAGTTVTVYLPPQRLVANQPAISA